MSLSKDASVKRSGSTGIMPVTPPTSRSRRVPRNSMVDDDDGADPPQLPKRATWVANDMVEALQLRAQQDRGTKQKKIEESAAAKPDVVKVTVTKETWETKLGIKLHKTEKGVVAVSKISKTSIFQRTKLKVGYELVSINCIPCDDLDPEDCLEIMQEIEHDLTIVALPPVGRNKPVATSPVAADEKEKLTAASRSKKPGAQAVTADDEEKKDLGKVLVVPKEDAPSKSQQGKSKGPTMAPARHQEEKEDPGGTEGDRPYLQPGALAVAGIGGQEEDLEIGAGAQPGATDQTTSARLLSSPVEAQLVSESHIQLQQQTFLDEMRRWREEDVGHQQQQVPTVSAVPLEEDKNCFASNKRRTVLIAVLTLVAIIAIILGVVLSQNNSGSTPATLSPTPAPITLESVTANGKISTEIGLLTDLDEIDLTEDALTGTIPTEFGLLTRLKLLLLEKNELTGTLPTELGLLTRLNELLLEANKLTGTIPTELGRLTKADDLYLNQNKLTGGIPTELCLMEDLDIMQLSQNPLGGTIPTQFGFMLDLGALNLHETDITGTIPTELGLMTDMNRLHLWNNFLTGTIPTEIYKLTGLDRLYLHNNSLTGTFECPDLEGIRCKISCDNYQNVSCGIQNVTR